jgi:hypothetical protein
LDDDPPRGRPKVSLVVLGESETGDGVRLARDAANNSIHKTTPRAAVEGGDIAPNSSLM